MVIGFMRKGHAYIIDVISIALFETRGGEAHSSHPLRYVGDIQIILLCLKSFSLATDYFPDNVHCFI